MNEIIIEHGTKADIVGWLGEPVKEEFIDDGCVVLKFSDGKSVTVTEKLENKDWLSVAFECGKWTNDVDCAREAQKKIKKKIICDPNDGDTNPFKFLILENGSETVQYLNIDN